MKRLATSRAPARVGLASTLALACLLVALAAASPLALAQTPPPAAGAAAAAAPPEVQAALKTAALRGQGRLRFLGLRVYEAWLWQSAAAIANTAANDWAKAPLALEIRYQRDLKGDQIAERSLKEMRRQGDIDDSVAQRWLASMNELFPDVTDGTRITGIYTPAQGARFYIDGQAKGRVGDAEFARRFFGIWLAPETSEPALRAALLGQGRP